MNSAPGWFIDAFNVARAQGHGFWPSLALALLETLVYERGNWNA